MLLSIVPNIVLTGSVVSILCSCSTVIRQLLRRNTVDGLAD